MLSSGSICILPQKLGLGGPASFSARLIDGLQKRRIEVHHNPLHPTCAAILVIGGTRYLNLLWRAKAKGVRIVQRLDGMNWIHRKRPSGLRHTLRSEINNWILAIIRRNLADAVIYQSQFVQTRWNSIYGPINTPTYQIYNGVDLSIFNPQGPHRRPKDHLRVLVVEGSLKGGHDIGLENAIHLVEQIQSERQEEVELMIVANVNPNAPEIWKRKTDIHITWGGVVPRESIPEIDRSAHLFFSAEVNAPCPNSVIEALACGLPVISYATGSLPELVQGDSGRLVSYGENFSHLGSPDFVSLAKAAQEILASQEHFRAEARLRAERNFDIEKVVDQYCSVLLQ